MLENELQQGTQVHLLHVVLRADEEQHSYLPHADYFEQVGWIQAQHGVNGFLTQQ